MYVGGRILLTQARTGDVYRYIATACDNKPVRQREHEPPPASVFPGRRRRAAAPREGRYAAGRPRGARSAAGINRRDEGSQSADAEAE
jgi:hypothetical protein